MGRASISIAITSNFNGKGVDAAIRKMEQLAVSSVAAKGQFGKAAVQMGSDLGKASHQLSTLGQNMAKIGDTLTTHVTIPMGIAAAAAIKSAVDIDTAWYNVRKTVDMTEEGYQQLKQGAIELSNVQPVSAETILNIEALGGQLGISNQNLESFAKTVSGLDISTNLDAETAATQLAQFANITQMSENDLDNFSSALVDLGNHSATTEADIMNLALRFASAGHVAGMSNQEILGISASLSSLGMKADAGGSALSQIINQISLDVDTNGEHLEAWAQLAGKSIDDFKNAWKNDAAGTFEDVLQGIAKSGDEMNAVLDDVGVTQIRTSDAMRRLASSGDLMSESIKRANTAWQENTALSREVENRNESLASRFEVIKNRLTNAMATIGEPIAQMTLKALDGLDPLIQGAQDLATSFANADPVTQRFAFNLGATAMAAGPVLSVLGRGIDVAGQFGVKVARTAQQFGVFTEALHTNDLAMLTNLSENDSFAAKLGVSRNAAVRAAGGVDQFKAKVKGATAVIQRQAAEHETAVIATERYAKALGATGSNVDKLSHSMFNNAEAITFGTQANQRFTQALWGSNDGIIRGSNNMRIAAANVNRYQETVKSSAAAQEFLADTSQRFRDALANGAKSGTEAAQAALRYKDNTAAAAVEATRAAAAMTGQDKISVRLHSNLTEAAQAALGFADNTSKSAVEASRSAKEALGYQKALSGTSKSATSAAQAAVKYTSSQKGQSEAASRATKATKDLSLAQIDAVAKTKEGSAEIAKQAESAKKTSTVLSGLGSVLLGIGGIAITAAAFAGIEYLATQAQIAAERAENLKGATEGLRNALNDIGPAQQAATQSHDEFIASLGKTHQHAMDAVASQAALADSFNQIDQAASVQIGTLDRARDAIQQYAFAGDLNQAAQYRLQQAIATVNEACGTQYSVIDSSRGIIADETGAVLENKDAILQNIDARKQMIQLQALEEKYGQLYAQQIDTTDAYTEAVHNLNEAKRQEKDLEEQIEAKRQELHEHHIFQDDGDVKNMLGKLEETRGQITGLEQDVSELEQTREEGTRGLNKLENQMNAVAESAENAGDALEDGLFNQSGLWSSTFGQAEASIEAFNAVCHDMGLNFDALNSLDSSQIDDLARAFKDSGEKAEGVVTALENMGDKGKTILDNLVRDWKAGFSDGTSEMVASVAKMRDESEAMLMAHARDFGVAGETATRMFLEGLNTNMDLEPAANLAKAVYSTFEDNINPEQMQALATRVGDAFQNGLSPEQANAIAAAYSQALTSGMDMDTAATKATDAVQKITDATNQLSPEQAAAVMNAYSNAIKSGVDIDTAATDVENAIQKINDATNGLDPAIASAAMQTFADALNNGASFDDAASGIENAIQKINDATNGLDPSVATAAMDAFAAALKNGASFEDAATSVEDAINQIKDAVNGLSEADAATAIQAFVDAINSNLSLEDAIAKAKEQAEQLKSGVQDTLNNASFDSSGWQAKFAELGRVGPEAFNQQIQGWGPVLSDATGNIVTNAVNGINPHVEVWSQKANEGPQAYNNALTPWGSTIFSTTSDIANQSVSGLELGIPGAGTAGSETSSNYANMIGTMQSTAVASAVATQIAVVLAYKAGIEVALTAGQMTGQNYGTGLQQGMSSAVDMVYQSVAMMATAFSGGMEAASAAGSATGTAYAMSLALGLAVGVNAAQNAASMIGSALNSSVGAASAAGSAAGSGYAMSLATGLAVGVNAAQNAATMVTTALTSTIDPASSAGTAAGTAYATNLAVGLATAVLAAQRSVQMIVAAFNRGISPAGTAGRSTGSAYATGVSTGRAAVSIAQGIASGVASAFASTVGWAYSSGYAMGQNFAAGVRAGGAAAIAEAHSIASQVASILKHSTPKTGPLHDDDVWGLHFAQNLASGIKQGAPAVVAAANQVATSMAIPATAATTNYALAQGALTKAVAPIDTGSFITNSQLRSYTSRVDRNSQAYKAGVSITKNYTREINNSSPGIDYDTMYRVVEAGVANAIKKSGGIAPVVELDGRRVSRQLVNYLDSDFNRLRQMRG